MVKDPTKRLNLDEILNSEFMTANPYPKALPSSLLVCPPSTQYLRQYLTGSPDQQTPVRDVMSQQQSERNIATAFNGGMTQRA